MMGKLYHSIEYHKMLHNKVVDIRLDHGTRELPERMQSLTAVAHPRGLSKYFTFLTLIVYRGKIRLCRYQNQMRILVTNI